MSLSFFFLQKVPIFNGKKNYNMHIFIYTKPELCLTVSDAISERILKCAQLLIHFARLCDDNWICQQKACIGPTINMTKPQHQHRGASNVISG